MVSTSWIPAVQENQDSSLGDMIGRASSAKSRLFGGASIHVQRAFWRRSQPGARIKTCPAMPKRLGAALRFSLCPIWENAR